MGKGLHLGRLGMVLILWVATWPVDGHFDGGWGWPVTYVIARVLGLVLIINAEW